MNEEDAIEGIGRREDKALWSGIVALKTGARVAGIPKWRAWC
jgi:hypothetical protein